MRRVLELTGGLILGSLVALAALAQDRSPGIGDQSSPQDRVLPFSEHLIADKYGYTFGVAAWDLDGDDDLDLTNVDIVGKNPSAASLLWFENDGRGNFQRHVIHGPWPMHVLKENYFAANQIIAADLDGDNRPDLVATADDGSRRVQGANELRCWRSRGIK
jgi:hypothetical protein